MPNYVLVSGMSGGYNDVIPRHVLLNIDEEEASNILADIENEIFDTYYEEDEMGDWDEAKDTWMSSYTKEFTDTSELVSILEGKIFDKELEDVLERIKNGETSIEIG